jgi:type I restriction enzyme S subunit
MNDFSLGNYYIDKNKFDEMKSFAIKQGDILLTGAGTIGKIAIVPEDFAPGIINQALIRITLDRSKILIPYFTYLLNHETYTRKVLGSSHGATMKNISSIRNLSSLKIPLPSITEQQRIVEILSVVDRKLEMERNGKAKLERIKRGLMDLLLTGRVRVKVD